MTDVQVWVSEAGVDVLAGTLYSQRRRNTESATFVYDEAYVAQQGAYSLEPALPLALGPHHTPADLAIFNAFSDSSPDRWGRTLVKRAERLRASEQGETPRSLSELDYLLGARDDLRQGALRFRLSDGGPFLATDDVGVPALNDLGELLDVAAKVESDTAAREEILRMLKAGSSLGGMRPKCHVRSPNGSVGIAKFPSSRFDRWNVTAWEKVALDLAASAGIDVPDSQLVEIAGRNVLIVTRFDRDDDRRIGYCSALTMLEARDGQQRSYLDIASKIEEISPSATDELHQLWRRVAFSILISNTDDHLRNIGFLHTSGSSWRLSPAFDLNPNPEPGPRFLSTAIDDGETRASVSVLLEVAPFFRLDDGAAMDILREVHDAVQGWIEVAEANGLSPDEVKEMEPGFRHAEQEQVAAAVA